MEARTRQPLQRLAQEHVFGPLGMGRSSLVWEERFAANAAVGHDQAGTVLGVEMRRSARAAGSMVTTPRDYGRFVRQVLKRKGLSRRWYRQMLSPQIRVDSRRSWGPGRDDLARQPDPEHKVWGLGWGLFAGAHGRAFWHNGHADGWQNFCVSYPRRRLSVILFSNSDNFGLSTPSKQWRGR